MKTKLPNKGQNRHWRSVIFILYLVKQSWPENVKHGTWAIKLHEQHKNDGLQGTNIHN